MFLLGHACEHDKFTQPDQKVNIGDVRNPESLDGTFIGYMYSLEHGIMRESWFSIGFLELWYIT